MNNEIIKRMLIDKSRDKYSDEWFDSFFKNYSNNDFNEFFYSTFSLNTNFDVNDERVIFSEVSYYIDNYERNSTRKVSNDGFVVGPNGISLVSTESKVPYVEKISRKVMGQLIKTDSAVYFINKNEHVRFDYEEIFFFILYKDYYNLETDSGPYIFFTDKMPMITLRDYMYFYLIKKIKVEKTTVEKTNNEAGGNTMLLTPGNYKCPKHIAPGVYDVKNLGDEDDDCRFENEKNVIYINKTFKNLEVTPGSTILITYGEFSFTKTEEL